MTTPITLARTQPGEGIRRSAYKRNVFQYGGSHHKRHRSRLEQSYVLAQDAGNMMQQWLTCSNRDIEQDRSDIHKQSLEDIVDGRTSTEYHKSRNISYFTSINSLRSTLPIQDTQDLSGLSLGMECQTQIKQMIEAHGRHFPVRVLHDRSPLIKP